MALAKRKARPEPLFVAAKPLTPSAGHPFNQKLNQVLDENDRRGHSSFPMNVPLFAMSGRLDTVRTFSGRGPGQSTATTG
jgi:hypothetical protein